MNIQKVPELEVIPNPCVFPKPKNWKHPKLVQRGQSQQFHQLLLAGSDMELAFVCMGKKSLAESAEYFPNMEFVLGNIVRIDEDVTKYMMILMLIISVKMSS